MDKDKAKIEFDAIIGNPPYQVNDGGGKSSDSANPIYHEFVRISKIIQPRFISLIMPSKWMVGGKKQLEKFRKEMIQDNHLSKIFDYENARHVFEKQNMDGGICYFLWDRKKTETNLDYTYIDQDSNSFTINRPLGYKNTNNIIRDLTCSPIIEKVTNEKTCTDIASVTKPFGLRKDVFNNPEKYAQFNLSDKPFEDSLKIYGVKGVKGRGGRVIGYISSEAVKRHKDWVDKYKLFITTAFGTQYINIPEIIVAEPKEICTETFLVIGPFGNKTERDNCYTFTQTSFFKTLLFFGRGTMQVSQGSFRFIPLQDFTDKSDINWHNSIEDIDKQLFNKYKFTSEDIAFIDNLIKTKK